MKQLINKFLIAMPSISDPIFKKSLILLCNYDKNGAMGLIINKPIDNEMISEIFFNKNTSKIKKKTKIYFGGPVSLNTGFVLHDSNYSTNKTLNISKELSITSDEKIFKDIELSCGPTNFLLTLGYAGWDKGQLEHEIKNGDWLIAPADSNFIFKTSDDKKWDVSSTNLGINLNDLSGRTGLA